VPREGDLRILRGDDVQRYFIRGSLYFSREAPEMKPYLGEVENLMVPHIVAQRIVAHVMNPEPHIILMAAYEEHGAFAFNTVTNFIVSDPNYDYRYILALLNSRLLSYYAYKFLYSNAIRSMDFYEGYAKRLPIYPLSKKEQKLFIDLVGRLINLKQESLVLVVDFERYWAPLADQITLKYFYNRLPIGDKEILNRTARGSIKSVRVEEIENWLTFIVDYSVTERGEKKEFKDMPILKCRFSDEALRKFLLHVVLNCKRRLGTGNISSKVLEIPIPRFDKDETKNREAIRKVMADYLKVMYEKEKLEKEIKEIDEKIDDAIFKLYDLTDEEINIIKIASGMR